MVARPQTTAAEVRERLACGRSGCACRRPGELTHCPVPSHGQGRGDRSPSLSVTDGPSEIIVNCHGGCDWREVKAALGLGAPTLRLPERLAPPAPRALFRDPGQEPDGPSEADVGALIARAEPIAGTPAESYLRARGSWDLDGTGAPPGCRWWPREALPWPPPAGAVGAIGYVHARPEPGRLVPVGVQLEGLDAHGERLPDRWRRCYGTKPVHVVHDPAPRAAGPVTVAIAEGELTAQALASLGVAHVALATGGRSGLAPETMRPILATLTGGRGLVVLSPDGDATGREAMRRLEVALLADGYTVRADAADAWEREGGRDALDEASDTLAAGATWGDLWLRRAKINADIAREVEAEAAAGADRSRADIAPALAIASILEGLVLSPDEADAPDERLPAVLERTDGEPFIGEGILTVINGDPESGKTWMLLAAAAAALRRGACFLFLVGEGRRKHNAKRLLQLGAREAMIRQRVFYVTPDEWADEAIRRTLVEYLQADRAARGAPMPFVGYDSLTSLDNAGADAATFDAWVGRYLAPFAGVESTRVALGHLPKHDKKTRGTVGTYAQLATPDVTLRVEQGGEIWTDRASGYKFVTLEKGREGGYPADSGRTLAVVRGTWHGEGDERSFALTVEPPAEAARVQARDAGTPHDAIIAALRARGEPLTATALEEQKLGFRGEVIRGARRELVAAGEVTETPFPGGRGALYGLPEWADGDPSVPSGTDPPSVP